MRKGLARPTLYLSLRVLLVVRVLGAAAPHDAVAHVQQHHVQRVRVHTPLVGLSRALHVLHHAAVLHLHLQGAGGGRERGSEGDDMVDNARLITITRMLLIYSMYYMYVSPRDRRQRLGSTVRCSRDTAYTEV